MVRLNWSNQSVDDLENIAEFIARDSVKYAKRTIKKIRETAKVLKDYPALGRIVPETEDKSIRELIIGNYRLIYKISGKTRIDILTVHNAAKLVDVEFLKT